MKEMNNGVRLIRSIVDATCEIRELDVPEDKRNWIASHTWMACGLDKKMVIECLHKEFLELEKSFFRKVT